MQLINEEYNKQITDMLNKIVGYSGFRSYGEVEYPTEKQAKELQRKNEIWSSTVRGVDHVPALQNYHNFNTVYKDFHLENTRPKDYHPAHVIRGANSTLNFPNQAAEPYDAVEAQQLPPKYAPLQSGTEHWRSDYQQTISKPKTVSLQKDPSKTHATQFGVQPSGARLNNTMSQMKSGSGSYLQQGVNETAQLQRSEKALNAKEGAYMNNCPTGTTDYRFNYGQKIGSSPMDILHGGSTKQPLRRNPLKLGTNQLWTEIPRYQGFKPAGLPYESIEQKILQREQKGGPKVNLIENYHLNIPGYAGFRSTFQVDSQHLRESCFHNK